MDDITFRRRVYADPNSKDADLIAAAKSDPKKRAFWDETKAFERSLASAAQVPIPEGFAEKLLLKQSFEQQSETLNRKHRPWYIALAASFALVVTLTLSNTQLSESPSTQIVEGQSASGHSVLDHSGSSHSVSNSLENSLENTLENEIFAHVNEAYMNKEVMMSNGEVNVEQINEKLKTFNTHIDSQIGKVVSANYCYLDAIKSLHLIIQGEYGLVNLFVTPQALTQSLQETFNSASHYGTSFLVNTAKVIIIGESGEDVLTLKNKASQLFAS